MNGIELALRFSFVVNKLGYCGPHRAYKQFLRFTQGDSSREDMQQVLARFEGLLPYLRAIADKHNKHWTDHDVVEAYWIGNTLLDVFKTDDLKSIINTLATRGLPKRLAAELNSRIPEGCVPHHNFNVMFVGVGNLTRSVHVTLQNMDNCRTSWGTVQDISNNTLTVRTQPLAIQDKKLVLGKHVTKKVTYAPELLSTVRVGNIVALHWNFAPVLLTTHQLSNLKKYTTRILSVVNTTHNWV